MDLASTTSPGTAHGNRVIKVDHAGEHGAVCIYTAQILFARLTAPGLVEELVGFREHERAHRKIFEDELARRSHPRCRSYWLCGLGGFVLGAVTGLLGRRAIAATTVAIESVVLRHLRQQIAELSTDDPRAVAAIAAIIEDEMHHHDQSARHVDGSGAWSRVLTPVVSGSTEAVIWLGMRL